MGVGPYQLREAQAAYNNDFIPEPWPLFATPDR